jgi:hypothetical protein
MSVLGLKGNFKLRADKGWLKVTNFTPASGIGHFDATYDPQASELLITVRMNFTFFTHKESLMMDHAAKIKADPSYVTPSLEDVADGPKWTHEEMAAYKRRFAEIQKRVWSQQYQFNCSKPDWPEYKARVRVAVDTEAPRGNSHYKIRVFKNPPESVGRAMISHAPQWDGIFYESDTQVEENTRRDKAHMFYVMNWLDKVIEMTSCDFIEFDKGSEKLTTKAEKSIEMFAQSARRYLNERSEKAGVKIWVYAKSGSGELFVKPTARSAAIAAKLLECVRPHHGLVEIVPKFSKEDWIKMYVERNLKRRTTLSPADINKRSFQGAMLIVKNYANDTKLAPKITGFPRNYIVAAHEFGHVLGNPDEYQGICCEALKTAIERSSPVPPTAVFHHDRLTEQHEGISRLIKAADIPAPFYGTSSWVTESIMYAGSQVLPAHYAPFWEALLNCTWPYMLAGDWKIVPDAPNNRNYMS